MTTRSTTFSDSAAGQLEVIFSGAYVAGSTSDPGFPSGGGSSDITLECTVSDAGGQLAKTYIERSSPSAHLLLTYPGGGTNWTVSMSDVSHSIAGLGGISVTPRVNFILVKK